MYPLILPAIWFILACLCTLRAVGEHLINTPSAHPKVSHRHYKVLCITGVVSYLLQVGIYLKLETDFEYNITALIVTGIAFGCFWIVTSYQFIESYKCSQRDTFQTLLWGQLVFPVVLLAIPGFLSIISTF